MPAFSLSIRRYATNEAGCGASFTFLGGWAEIAKEVLGRRFVAHDGLVVSHTGTLDRKPA